LTWTFRPKKKITNKKENTYKNKFERAHTRTPARTREAMPMSRAAFLQNAQNLGDIL
jgi:hypothetical protein